jgi:hypothetical protein
VSASPVAASVVAVGLFLGCWIAIAILLSHLIAARFMEGGTLSDVVVRLFVFGALSILGSELVGQFFGPNVRAEAAWFWGAFVIGFFSVPSIFWLFTRRRL